MSSLVHSLHRRAAHTNACAHYRVIVCLHASLLKGSYVLMRCKWLQEVVSHSLNRTPLHLWSPDFGGPRVVIVMLFRPPDRLWRIGFDWSIDRHVAASFSFSSTPPSLPLTSFSLKIFLKKALRNWTACHVKSHSDKVLFYARNVKSQQHQTPRLKQISFVTIYAKHFIFRRICFEDVFWSFLRSNWKSGI